MKRLAVALEELDGVLDCTLLSAGACHAAVGRVQDHRSALSADEREHIGRAVSRGSSPIRPVVTWPSAL